MARANYYFAPLAVLHQATRPDNGIRIHALTFADSDDPALKICMVVFDTKEDEKRFLALAGVQPIENALTGKKIKQAHADKLKSAGITNTDDTFGVSDKLEAKHGPAFRLPDNHLQRD